MNLPDKKTVNASLCRSVAFAEFPRTRHAFAGEPALTLL
jgi:hypothetical protein